ncbi:MAG TPA: hypothetical protein VME69_05710 [Methylocella sp.]|nr:hypothetical protein [Methylocella sp.]
MPKLFACVWLILVASSSLPLQAQVVERRSNAAPPQTASHLLRENHLTPTGATVVHPGESQGAPTSPLDRRIMQKNNLLDQSICSNCD